LGLSLNLSILISDKNNKYEALSTGEGNERTPHKLIVMIVFVFDLIIVIRWEVVNEERHSQI